MVAQAILGWHLSVGRARTRLGQGLRGDVAELWDPVGVKRLQEVAGVAEGHWAPDWGLHRSYCKDQRGR